eukprot:CAMPEP_0183397430 /NCGR_PEP_ID=MMETSP0370-20130417/10599_1 /TAXON_ID=268820 /ORGANISM="Peridinium aciculiferum, Strain PAER-2" /LENGTH=125 /DNA_ID=CAMNT_0025578317 /DNA_START=31 /DNA_END=407 /DNA_ORIENTATION=+
MWRTDVATPTTVQHHPSARSLAGPATRTSAHTRADAGNENEGRLETPEAVALHGAQHGPENVVGVLTVAMFTSKDTAIGRGPGSTKTPEPFCARWPHASCPPSPLGPPFSLPPPPAPPQASGGTS